MGMDYLRGGGAPSALNLGTGHGYTVREVIDVVERVSGRRVPVVEGPRRDGDSETLVADPRKAEQVLGWKARHSSIEEIVRNAWAWHSIHRAAYALLKRM
jgi:UDP-glucose 4-epimerase